MEDLQRRIAAAEEQVSAAEHAVRTATAAADVARQDWVAARARLGAPPLAETTPGPPTITQPAETGNHAAVSSLPSPRKRRNP